MTGDAVAAGVTYTNGGTVPLISTISDSVVTGKILGNSFNPQTGSVQATDSILEALEKLQGQVTNLPQGLVYQGIWSAAGTGGGTPDLTVAGTKVNGHFYICDTAGSAAPNGTGTTPNDWDVRDWVIFADDGAGGGVDEWQKIDNSSLAGGSGTTNTITKWTNNQVIGNSSMTDDGSTITIADTVDFITQGNNTFGNTSADASSFLGNVTLSENLILEKGLALDSSSSVPYGSAGQVLTSGGNINIANTWTTPTIGTVTSVALTETGDALTITGSPVTSSGTINIAGAGASTDYINGELNLVAFPTSDNYVSWTADSDEGTDITVTSGFNLKFTGAVTAGGAGIATDSAVSANEMTIGLINAGGTPGATTFYRGDGQWSVPVGTKTETLEEVLGNGNTSGANDIVMTDSQKITFGAAPDLQLFHDTSNSYIETTSGSEGDLYIKSNGTGHDLYLQATDDVFIRPQSSNDGIKVIGGGAVELYHNAVKKFQTTNTGVYVTGTGVFTQDLWINTSQKLFFDNGGDCYISEDTTGRLKFVVDGSEFMRLGDGIPDTITFYKDSTFTGNVEIDGNLTVDGAIIHGGGGAGIFTGSKAINSSTSVNAFTLQKSTGTLIFDIWLTSETSTATSVSKKYTVAHSYGTTPVYNKIIDTGPDGSNDFTVSFANAGTGGDSVNCSIISNSIAAQTIGYTVQVGHDGTNALTFTAG